MKRLLVLLTLLAATICAAFNIDRFKSCLQRTALIDSNAFKPYKENLPTNNAMEINDCSVGDEILDYVGADTRNVKNLTVLNANITNVKFGDAGKFEGLKSLVLHKNNLTIIDGLVTKLKELVLLDLRDNSIERIVEGAFDGLLELKELNLEGNRIGVVGYELRGLAGLEKLDLGRNEINTCLPNAFDGLTSLLELNLENNELVVINDEFSAMPKLQKLYLNNNQIAWISGDAFKGLGSLKTLHLFKNDLSTFEDGTFRHLNQLHSLDLNNNGLEEIETGAFDGLEKLTDLNLNSNDITRLGDVLRNTKKLERFRMMDNRNLETIPNKFFDNLTNLLEVHLSECSIKELPSDLFVNTNKLVYLDLNDNFLMVLPRGAFKDLISLKRLNLKNNVLVSTDGLAALKALEVLNLNFNKLESIQSNTLPGNLKELFLSHNQLSSIEELKGLSGLVRLDISYNNITSYDISLFFTELEVADFSNNKITVLNRTMLYSAYTRKTLFKLNDNNITSIDLTNIEQEISDNPGAMPHYNTIIELQDSSFECDCRSYDFFRYLQNDVHANISQVLDIRADRLKCAWSSLDFRGQSVKSVNYTKVACPMKGCVDECRCLERTYDGGLVFDCAGRGLRQVPQFKLPRDRRYPIVEVMLQDNYIREFVGRNDVLEAASVLNLSGNGLEVFAWVSNNTEVVKLSYNNLTLLSAGVVANLTGEIFLDNNPWICDCKSLAFFDYVKSTFLPNKANITCANKHQPLAHLRQFDICPSYLILIVSVTTFLLVLMGMVSASFALYYKFNREIKVWLYAHNMFLWFVTEEDLDKDKEYDAFVCFSQVDESFVVKQLVAKLETGKNPYKLCIHMRDFIPGEEISTQIYDSVKKSRRTIVLLSSDFLNSVWGQMEFRTAHTEAMLEGVNRVIVIILGDVENDERLDDDLNVYLKTKTYIKWGDPWFWDKVMYALPHRKRAKKEIQQKINKQRKWENMSLKLDKLDLIRVNSVPNAVSTPPGHPLLNKNPLDTPPAESGNDVVKCGIADTAVVV